MLTQRRADASSIPLLLLSSVIGLVAFATVHYLRRDAAIPPEASTLIWPFLACAGFLASAGIIGRRSHSLDPVLLPLVSFLVGLSLALIHHVRPDLISRQVFALGLGLAAMTVFACQPDLRWLARFKYLFAGAACLLVVAVIVFGKPLGPRGEIRLAIPLGPAEFQPADLVRIFMVIFLAGFMSEKQEALVAIPRPWKLTRQDGRFLGPLLAAWGLTLMLLVTQRDLGAALLLFGIFLSLLYVGTGREVYLVLGLSLFALGAWGASRTFAVVNDRIQIWWDPWTDPDGKGYQILQSLYALGGGGMFGAGLGQGAPEAVPAVHTDLIFSAAAEELGLVGAAAILLAYALIVYRGFRIALRARDPVHSLLATGLSLGLGLQALIIIGGAIKLIPLTGVTLPFMSYGGSSLIANCALIGMLMGISGDNGWRIVDYQSGPANSRLIRNP